MLLAADGNFYGGTSGAPVTSFTGVVYQMTPSGTVTTVSQFPAKQSPSSALIQGRDGNFYGTATDRVTGTSFVYRLTQGGALTVLHTFHTGNALGVIQGPNGNLYGVTEFGGTANEGTVFELSTAGPSFHVHVLHNFGDGSVANDGEIPSGILILGADNNFYGETSEGGSRGGGTVFKISP